jgi:hypothetical protein
MLLQSLIDAAHHMLVLPLKELWQWLASVVGTIGSGIDDLW